VINSEARSTLKIAKVAGDLNKALDKLADITEKSELTSAVDKLHDITEMVEQKSEEENQAKPAVIHKVITQMKKKPEIKRETPRLSH